MTLRRLPLSLGVLAALVASGPATAAEPDTKTETPAVQVEPGLDLLAGYTFRLADQGSPSRWDHAFELPRAQVSLDVTAEKARGRLAAEAVRSAEDGALTGVGGDSLLLRLREARVGYAPWESLSLDVGLIPTAFLPAVDATLVHRELGRSVLESAGLFAFADLGASATVSLPRRYGQLTANATNGEGYTSPERNRGKNLELAAHTTPFQGSFAAPLGARLAYVMGSSGTGRTRADRLAGLVAWDAPRLGLGVLGAYAWGAEEDGSRRVVVGEAFARGEPFPRLLFAARASLELADFFAPAGATGDQVLTTSLSGGYRLAAPLEAFLVVSRTSPSATAEAREPAAARWELSTFARFRL